MKRIVVRCFCFSVACALNLGGTLIAQPTQLLSVPNTGQELADSGSGDSITPIISADGRYVLFASTANNLIVIGTNRPIPAVAPAPLNVYLRDRVSATTTLVSVNSAGTGGGNDNSWPVALSTNAQFVLFESSASDLVSGDTNKATDVFVRDLVHAQTLLVSAKTNGVAGNRDSSGSAMTPDGRYVAYLSSATDLVANDTNGIADVFVRDLQTGSINLVSAGARSVSSLVQPSVISPEISDDGRYVLFTSAGTNLVPGVQTTNELYLRDLVAGTTAWVSIAATQAVWDVFKNSRSASFNYILSRDGRYVAYEAYPLSANGTTGIILRYDAVSGLTDIVSTNALALSLGNNRSLDMTPDGRFVALIGSTNGAPWANSSIFVWDGLSGASTLASGDLNGNIPSNSICAWPVLDSAGQYVAFLSAGSGLVTNPLPIDFHLYVRDLVAASTVLASADTNGAGGFGNSTPIASMSADGRFVAFESADAKLVPRDSNRNFDVFVRDISSNSTELISARASALPSVAANAPNTISLFSVSSDGRFIAFSSDADNLIANDTNGCRDIFVRDLLLGTNLLVSANTNGVPANNFATDPAISGNGRYVAFVSAATDLVPGDTNKDLDVFVRDLQAGSTTLISVNTNGTGSAKKGSFSPQISADGRFVVFHSTATDLAPGTLNNVDNLFLRDRQLGVTRALTTAGAGQYTMTSDGHYIAFIDLVSLNIYVWDTQASTRIFTNHLSFLTTIALSPNGRRLLYSDSSGLRMVDPVAHTSSSVVTTNFPGLRPGLRFSADSRFLAVALSSGVSVTNQIYVIDLQFGTNLLVSHKFNSSSLPANASSDSPDISADGRYIAYRSAATDILPADTIGVPDVFLYDRQMGNTTLLTQSRFGNYSADNRSRSPVFSADGKILFFESSASDLVDQTFSFNPNIFAYGTYVLPPFPVAIALDSQGPLLSWPTVPGKSYEVLFKNGLNDPLWQPVSGNVFYVGSTEYFRDTALPPAVRFYRVREF